MSNHLVGLLRWLCHNVILNILMEKNTLFWVIIRLEWHIYHYSVQPIAPLIALYVCPMNFHEVHWFVQAIGPLYFRFMDR